jgi:hypothetical protein
MEFNARYIKDDDMLGETGVVLRVEVQIFR